jgi:hypothetical protein
MNMGLLHRDCFLATYPQQLRDIRTISGGVQISFWAMLLALGMTGNVNLLLITTQRSFVTI